jgi:hypothetical protein
VTQEASDSVILAPRFDLHRRRRCRRPRRRCSRRGPASSACCSSWAAGRPTSRPKLTAAKTVRGREREGGGGRGELRRRSEPAPSRAAPSRASRASLRPLPDRFSPSVANNRARPALHVLASDAPTTPPRFYTLYAYTPPRLHALYTSTPSSPSTPLRRAPPASACCATLTPPVSGDPPATAKLWRQAVAGYSQSLETGCSRLQPIFGDRL